jgi:hypothetical protein
MLINWTFLSVVIVKTNLYLTPTSSKCCTLNHGENVVESSWNVMAHGDAWRTGGKVKGNKKMEWVTSKHHMTAEHRRARTVQTLHADVHSSPASSRLNWRPRRFKWTRPLRRRTKCDFCICAITFQTQSTYSTCFVPLKFRIPTVPWYGVVHLDVFVCFLFCRPAKYLYFITLYASMSAAAIFVNKTGNKL